MHLVQEAPGVALVLEADNEVVGVAHDDHIARGLTLSPAHGPEIKDVVQVDVGQERRDYRALPRSPVTDGHDPVFHDARLEPFADQADDAPVADPMLHEPDEPFLAHTTHLRDISSFVTILRERHPFEGRSLQVMGTIKRRGVLLLLVVLPDGSRSLIPASWTNWEAADVAHELSASRCEQRAPCLASLADL